MNKALLIIDVQKGLFKKKSKIYSENLLLNNINSLIQNFAGNSMIVYIQHNNRQLVKGDTDWDIHFKT